MLIVCKRSHKKRTTMKMFANKMPENKLKVDTEKAKSSCIEYYDKAHEEYLSEYRDELIKKPYDKDFLVRFIEKILPNGEILDIGCCSAAQQARFFLSNGFKVTSIDLSEKCIETAKRNFTGIEFKQMDMTEMDFEKDSFDAINAFYSIIHIPNEKLDGLFAEMNKILRKKGKLAITVHTGDFYGYFEENGIPVFYRTYTKKELIDILTNHGFQVLDIQQREPIYDFEFQSDRIYLIAEKI